MSASTQSASAAFVAMARPAAWKILLAFSIIYLVWGSTFLAIRVGVQQIPPFLMAGMRFAAAGVILYSWLLATGAAPPSRKEWRSAALVAVVIFVCDYGLLFWAEQKVPSGIAAVMVATIPAFMALSEIFFLKKRRLTLPLSVALVIGLCGVGVLVNPAMRLGEAAVETTGALALLVAAVAWAVGSAMTYKLPLPASKPMSAAAQMLCGGAMLVLVSAALGEFGRFHFSAVSGGAWAALGYLIIPGSVVAFTAYVWLLHHESPTKVGTYAYVNPVVAVAVGYWLGGETVGPRTLLGSLLILASVVVITTTSSKPAAA